MRAIKGSLFVTDDIMFVRQILMDPRSTMLCLSLDEVDRSLEREFNRVVPATLLLPPASAVCAEIDGDEERFIQEYSNYLNSEIPTGFIVTILKLLHDAQNAIMYIPSFNEDSVWFNQLMMNFFVRWGITIGMSKEKGFNYDPRYDTVILEELYRNNYINVFQFIIETPMGYYPSDYYLSMKLQNELICFITPGETIFGFIAQYREAVFNAGTPFVKPAVSFDHGGQLC
ncbi:MAG: hypothetical protein IKA36_04060 [Clostridia bacterium]|nr:hypothetical protein [Clostridia bacterium]